MTLTSGKCYTYQQCARKRGKVGKDLNILFFLTPKSEVAYVTNEYSLRQVLEKMEFHRYSSIPMLDRNGRYVGTIT